MLLSFTVPITLILILWNFGQISGQTCRYADTCETTVTLFEPCGRWPPCRNVIVNKPCILEQSCSEEWSEWTSCSRTCGLGVRSRHGRCCGSRCTRLIDSKELCREGPCPDPPTPRPCDSTPCVRGTCLNIANDTAYSCDCTGTGFEGKDCETAQAIV